MLNQNTSGAWICECCCESRLIVRLCVDSVPGCVSAGVVKIICDSKWMLIGSEREKTQSCVEPCGPASID